MEMLTLRNHGSHLHRVPKAAGGVVVRLDYPTSSHEFNNLVNVLFEIVGLWRVSSAVAVRSRAGTSADPHDRCRLRCWPVSKLGAE
jgi:hypothetical protein